MFCLFMLILMKHKQNYENIRINGDLPPKTTAKKEKAFAIQSEWKQNEICEKLKYESMGMEMCVRLCAY